MLNKILFLVLTILALSLANLAQATLIKTSDGSEVSDLSSTTSTLLNIDSTGQLLGAYNVSVNGALYDVAFIEGTYNDIYDEAYTSLVNTTALAKAMSQAIIDDLFINVAGYLFDKDPEKTYGCSLKNFCVVATPYRTQQGTTVVLWYAQNNYDSYADSVPPGGIPMTQDLSTSTGSVYAYWSLSPERGVAEVSAPASALIMLLGIGGLLLRQHKTLGA